MKAISLFTLLSCLLISINIFSQAPQSIEANLYKLYKKIDHWAAYRGEHRNDNVDAYSRANDSLNQATIAFGEKLKYYTEKYPSTITQKFALIAQNKDSIPKDMVEILTSSDGLFRIYSWDTRSDGTMYGFDNLIQYKTGTSTKSILSLDTGTDYVYYYSNLYTLKVNNKAYYLGVYEGIYSSAGVGTGIQVFAIEDGKLNTDVKLFKTATGLHSQLYYEYNFGSVAYWKVRPDIVFNANKKTIGLPLVDEKGNMTHKYISYKFTGQYFEKVKN